MIDGLISLVIQGWEALVEVENIQLESFNVHYAWQDRMTSILDAKVSWFTGDLCLYLHKTSQNWYFTCVTRLPRQFTHFHRGCNTWAMLLCFMMINKPMLAFITREDYSAFIDTKWQMRWIQLDRFSRMDGVSDWISAAKAPSYHKHCEVGRAMAFQDHKHQIL